MAHGFGKFKIGLAVAFLIASAGIGSVYAGEVTEDQIYNALRPKPLTRSLSGAPAPKAMNPDDQRFLDSLRTRRTRSLSAGERDRVATIAKEKQSIDLDITFDYNSATINRQGVATITKLGNVLTKPEMKGSVYLVAGHTDAKGGDEYNQGLSERRAEAIKRYLIDKFGLTAENLVSVGYGKSQLKNQANPFAEENRRVQVVNMESAKEAHN